MLGLIHLGPPRQEKEPPRAAAARRLRNVPAVISRADALEALERDAFDIAVVGGGITGAGVALDAASRGYSVALVERADYAAGTSSRSSKLVHGGLRYLQSFDLGLVREALRERSLMVTLAPHLVEPLPCWYRPSRAGAPTGSRGWVWACTTRCRGARAATRARNGARTVTAPSPAPRRSRWPRRWPGRAPTSAYLFYDCQTDDARLVLTILGEAERFGAVCVTAARPPA